MENYEVKNVCEGQQIQSAYEYAVKNNVQYYRAISKTNQIYGWDEGLKKFVKAQAGQEWFVNPHYVESNIIEEVVEEPVETVKEVAKNEIDYKTLYEKEVEKNSNKDHEIVSLHKEIHELKSENKTLEDELSDTQDELDEIKDTISKFKKLFV